MKKFKHKKTGWIATESFGNYWYKDEAESHFISVELVEDSADWEEIKEKDYEILSIRYEDNDKIYTFDGASFRCDGGMIKVEAVERGNLFDPPQAKLNIYIHSIKRLSDGEIFTVGDKIGHISTNQKGDILSIQLIDDWIFISTTYCDSRKGTLLKNATKTAIPKRKERPSVDKYTYEGKTYVILGYVPFKHPETREWLDAVHYLQLESGLDFVREKEEWFNQFKLVE